MKISIDRNVATGVDIEKIHAHRGVGAGVDTDQTVNPAKTISEKGFTQSL